MVVIEATKPKTPKARIFSESVKRYAGDFVKDVCYIEQTFFENADNLSNHFNQLIFRLSGRQYSVPLGYFPEKVDTWLDGRTTVLVNEHFLSQYQTLESLEGLAKHALAHTNYQLENQALSPNPVETTNDCLNELFPLRSLTMEEKFKLLQHCVSSEQEAAVIKKTIEIDPYSTIAEDFEIGNIVFKYFAKSLQDVVPKRQFDILSSASRKDIFMALLTNFHVAKDAVFLTSSNETVRQYRRRWIQTRKQLEESFFSELESELPEKAKILEDYRLASEKNMDELYSLIEIKKPETKEDFADLFTTLITGSNIRKKQKV